MLNFRDRKPKPTDRGAIELLCFMLNDVYSSGIQSGGLQEGSVQRVPLHGGEGPAIQLHRAARLGDAEESGQAIQ
jgi:hypothetical protein